MPTSRPRIQNTPRVDLQRVIGFLKNRETAHRGKYIALILGGIPLSLITPMIFTGFAVLGSGRRGRPQLHFWDTLPWMCLLMLPILFLLAWRIKGSILEASADTLETAGWYGRRHAVPPLIILELANIGPRMVLYGIKCWRGRQQTGPIDLNRAAQALSTLFIAEGSVHPAGLLLQGESPDRLEPLLSFLIFHELADVSQNGDRVWLSSDTRSKLESALRSP